MSILGLVKLKKVFVNEPSSYLPSLFSVVSMTFMRLSMIVPSAFFWQFSRSTIVSSVSMPFIPLLTIASVDPQSLRKRFWQSLTEFNMTMMEIGRRIVDDVESFLLATSIFSRMLFIIECIMSFAMTFKRLCKCVAKTSSGQCKSKIKVCSASSFHKT